MGRTCAGDSSGKNLAALRNILAELASILVVDGAVLAAEDTDLFLSVEAASLSERGICFILFIKSHFLYLLQYLR